MKILHIITRLDRGGSADNTLLTCIGQRRLGHEVTLVSGPGLSDESLHTASAQAKGVDMIACMAVNDVFVMDAGGRDRGVGRSPLLFRDFRVSIRRY